MADHQPDSANLTFRREVRQPDREAVRQLVAATGFFSAEEIAIAVELVDERLTRGLASGYEFVLLEDAAGLAGYACYGPIPGTANSFDLYWIVVDPARQRSGIGSRLLAAVEDHVLALGGRRIYIDTAGRAQYVPTHRFYERAGYGLTTRLIDFYAEGDDKLIFCRSLPPARPPQP